ncbi:30S ribosomal protein S1 [Pokkaliibacter sp. MBI-7]|uniref:30S ribosomal protein S1 n=1 Tax=Pokkaliibacter sp. MBI-7 TaxID=3040600 RepID=UPI00244AB404|nr:30S ribosomal protein S1 [Pokkaliibacter sp. MBI-7]MDH2435764.1 30S ribosomal protein S1 [Pokkaliibacter sp. MBI-7]
MSESFAELFEESLKEMDLQVGAIIEGTVVAIDKEWVTVNAGLKSEGVIPLNQFLNENGEHSLQVGAVVKVAVEALEDGYGATRLSREKAKRAEAWVELEKAFADNAVIKGIISGRVKGGFTVEIDTVRAFLPGSLIDVRPLRDTTHLEGKELEFKLIKLDQKRNNVVVSRRAVLEAENSAERETLLANLQEGQELKGIVKNLTDYGAFVDLGGVDGLLHITDMAWKRIRHPSEMLNVGDEIRVVVLKFDRDRQRVSLGIKQLGEDPWVNIKTRFPENSITKARVTNLTDYGCFAEIEDGIEGLVHVSEMDWTNKNIHPSKVVQVGDEVDVMILDIDEERRRISLGMKQCVANPWEAFSSKFNKGDRISGKIKSITDFGIFVGLDGGIDGLVHLSDISWNEPSEEAVKQFKKGDEIETVVLAVDPERERISLGVKQLDEDPFQSFVATNDKGAVVSAKVTALDAKGATVELIEGVEGQIKASELSRDSVDDPRQVLNVGDVVEARIQNIDRKNRVIMLSVKAKDVAEEKAAMQQMRQTQSEASGPTTIGDLIKEQLKGKQ